LHDRFASLAHETPRLREIPEDIPFMIWAMIKGQPARAACDGKCPDSGRPPRH
jgi:hypothetical protein